jgi:RNA polymerase sigma factor (sigma-70 family)
MEGIESPFGSEYAGDRGDAALVSRARAGEGAALDSLIEKHQRWIYNIVLRMVGSPEDAEDVTQEVLVKILTKLSTFKGKSGFRTWAYRIAVNHVLTMRRRPWERMFSSLDAHADLIDRLGASDGAPSGRSPVEEKLLAAETRMGCMSGMLLCLDRPQRMALVLGGFFGVSSALGGELLETTPENFRQILSRARKRLGNFMKDKCGLMDEANPCRCEKKIQAVISAGMVDPGKPRFDMQYLGRVRDFAAEHAEIADSAVGMKLDGLLRGQPMYEPPDSKRILAVMLRRGDLGKIIDWSPL